MKRYKNCLIDYESEECIDALLKTKHAKNLDEFKECLTEVMKTRKVYKYRKGDKDGEQSITNEMD